MSFFKRTPTCALDREPKTITADEPGVIYLHFPIEYNCPACLVRFRHTYIYEMNKRNLSGNKLLGVKIDAHNCIPSYVP